MEFARLKQRGLNQKTNKVWFSPCGNYRIDWASEFAGVSIDPRFMACVLSYGNTYGEQTFWNFAGKRGPYRTFNAAVEACEKNERLWKHVIQVCEGERKGRNEKLRVIDIKARIGTGPLCNRVLSIIPSWVRNVGNPVLMNQLFPRYESRVKDEDDECQSTSDQEQGSTPPNELSQSDPTDLSVTSDSESLSSPRTKRISKKTRAGGRASNAGEAAESMTRANRRTSSKATSSETESSAPAATATDTSPKKSSRKSTVKESKPTSRKTASTKRSSKRNAPASEN